MKTQEEIRTVETSQVFKEYTFGVKEENLAHIFKVLRSQLYSNKPKALLSEYCANAYDANIMAGNGDVPIEVTLPNSFEPVLKIKDRGVGLSENDVKEIYVSYGASNKRNSNLVAGNLGLGSKSGFAYGDNFLVVSYYNGTKTTYNAFLDPSEVGRIAVMAQEPTKEPNGVEVIIPVKPQHYETFKNVAAEIFKYYKVQPIIKGVTNFIVAKDITTGVVGNNWAYNGVGHSTLVMGVYGYSIDTYALEEELSEDQLACLRAGFTVECNMGDAKHNASREALEYLPLTINTIKTRVNEILAELPAMLIQRLSAAKNIFEAHQVYYEFFKKGNAVGNRLSGILKDKLVFNNILINDSYVDFQNKPEISVSRWHMKSGRRSYNQKLSSDYIKYIEKKPKTLLIVNDLGDENIKPRIQVLMDKRDSQNNRIYDDIYVFSFKNITTTDAVTKAVTITNGEKVFEDYTLLPVAEIEKISATAKPPRQPRTVSSSGINNQLKNTKKAFKFNPTHSQSFGWNKSAAWDITDVDLNGTGVFVTISHYSATDSIYDSPTKIGKALAKLEELGIKCELYGIKEKLVGELKGDWTTFTDFIKKSITNYIKTNNIESKLADFNALNEITAPINKLVLKVNDLSENSPYKKFIEIHNAAKAGVGKIKDEIQIINFFGTGLVTASKSDKSELIKLSQECAKRYPLLSCIQEYCASGNDLANYILAIDLMNDI